MFMTAPVYHVVHKLFDLNPSFWYTIYQNGKKVKVLDDKNEYLQK